mmetsp:Transcript_30579/g.30059  ORF Transcript_30579/g.30059 Transcript_30579/m.30059 type:complete len:429 (+) Transcript_30579:1334-2620(+)
MYSPEEIEGSLNNTFTGKNGTLQGTRAFSDFRSPTTKTSLFSVSTRHNRYKDTKLSVPSHLEPPPKDYQKNIKVIKKLQSEKKKREQVIKYVQEKQMKKSQIEAQKKEKEQELLKLEHEKEVQQWKDKLKQRVNERKELRKKNLIESEQKIKELKKQTPLFKSLERKYFTDFEIPELQHRKKALEEMRNMPNHSKVDIENIKKHSLDYEMLRKKKLEERIQSRMEIIKSQTDISKKLQTKTYQRMKLRDEMEISVAEEKKMERLKLIQSTKNYAKNVNDIYKPSISTRKQSEMKRLIEEIDKPTKDKINKIKYERSANSILNRPNILKTLDSGSSRVRDGNDTIQMSDLSRLNESNTGSPMDGNRRRVKDSIENSYYDDDLEIVPERSPNSKMYSKTPKRLQQRSRSSLRNTERKRLKNHSFNQNYDG